MMKHSVGYWLLVAVVMTGVMLLTADAAYAGSAGFFYCSNGQAIGSLYQSSLTCPKVLSPNNIFSFLVCNMEQLSSNLMGNMFCGMVLGLTPAIQAVLVLATLFFAAGFMIGVIPATAREFQVFLLKVACVWCFATQSDLLLDVGYKLLINGVRDGVAVTLTGYETLHTGGTQSSVYSQLDGFLAQMVKFATDYVGVDKNNAAKGCQNALWAVMAVMAIAFPPIFFLAIALIFRIAVTFLRAIFGYIYALVGIAFLLTLAPFFLSFFLFKQTRPFFEKWIGYLVSFALQIVILFAFLAFILSVNNSEQYVDSNNNGVYDGPAYFVDENNNGKYDVGEPFDDRLNNKTYDSTHETFVDLNNNGVRDTGIGTDITQLIMPVAQAKEGGSFRMPWEYCSVCTFEIYNPLLGPNSPAIPQSQYSKFLRTGKMRCIDYRDSKYPSPKPIGMDPDTGRLPIKLDAAGSPNTDQVNALMQFAGTGLMALIVLVYILESLLAYVGMLAQTLAGGMGGAWATQLVADNSTARMAAQAPGAGLIKDFEQGMDRGFIARTKAGANGLDAFGEGFRSAMTQMISGKTAKYGPKGEIEVDAKGNRVMRDVFNMQGERESGMGNRFIDWLVDPSKME